MEVGTGATAEAVLLVVREVEEDLEDLEEDSVVAGWEAAGWEAAG